MCEYYSIAYTHQLGAAANLHACVDSEDQIRKVGGVHEAKALGFLLFFQPNRSADEKNNSESKTVIHGGLSTAIISFDC